MVLYTQVVPIAPVDPEDPPKHVADHRPHCKSQKTFTAQFRIPFLRGRSKHAAVSLAWTRSTHFGVLTSLTLIAGFVWCGIRYYLMVDGENQVSTAAFRNLAFSIGNSIRTTIEQDLSYQDMVANVWAMRPQLTRSEFKIFINSDSYAPGLKGVTGMSLIPRIVGPAERATLEANADSEILLRQCCSGLNETGSSCGKVAATGLFCSTTGSQRYAVTEYGPNGTLVPAVGNSSAYLQRVGVEEYMVVNMIEPFEANAKVWGFNLLSDEARHRAWVRAGKTGLKTFTRRLKLVQSAANEYGFLVWLPIFKEASGAWTTALDGRGVPGLTPVGSVNGVYRAQQLLSSALESTYTTEHLRDVMVLLYDNAAELGGQSQYLGAYNSKESSPYMAYGQKTYDEVLSKKDDIWVVEKVPITIRSADAELMIIVVASDSYLSRRRTDNPTWGLIISAAMLLASVVDRILGHPALLVEKVAAEVEKHHEEAAVEKHLEETTNDLLRTPS